MKILINFSDGGTLKKQLNKRVTDVHIESAHTSGLLLTYLRETPDQYDVVIVRKGVSFDADFKLLCGIRDLVRDRTRIIYIRNSSDKLEKEQKDRLYRNGLYGFYNVEEDGASAGLCDAIITPRSLYDTLQYYGLDKVRMPASVKKTFSLATLQDAKLALEYLDDRYVDNIYDRYHKIIQNLPDDTQRQDFSLTIPAELARQLADDEVYIRMTQQSKRYFFKHKPVFSGKFPYLEEGEYRNVAAAEKWIRAEERMEIEQDNGRYAHIHRFAYTVIDPSCEKSGKRIGICSCGEKTEEAIAALGHDFGDESFTEEASCDKDGSLYQICQREGCGQKKILKIYPKINHSYGDWIVEKEPTCQEEGIKIRKCQICGETDTRNIPIVDCLPDKFENVQKLSCVDDEIKVARCVWCQKEIKELKPALGHDFDDKEITEAATCNKKGLVYKKCRRSGCSEKMIIKTLPKLDHTYGDWIVETESTCQKEGIEVRICTLCGEREERKLPLSECCANGYDLIQKRSCTEDGVWCGVCLTCGKSIEKRISATGHKMSKELVVPANCGKEGKRYKKCLNEGCQLEEVIKILPPTKQHCYDRNTPIILKAPSCVERGVSGFACSVCGGTCVNTILEKTDHQYGEWADDPNNCYRQIRICKNCHKEEERIDKEKPHHAADAENKIIIQAPSCVRSGRCKSVCAVCKAELSGTESVLPELGHDFSGDEIVEKPTCEKEGYVYKKCRRSGCSEKMIIKTLPKLDHTYGDWITEREATCRMEGVEKKVCTICGKEEIRSASITECVPGAFVTLQERSCVDDEVRVARCVWCQKEIKKLKPALGHDYSPDKFIKITPTCLSEGELAVKCKRCSAESAAGMIPKLDHVYDKRIVVMPADCVSGGKVIEYCQTKGCTASKEVVTQPLGHELTEWKTIKAATCLEEGMQERHCTRCAEKETRNIPATGHDLGEVFKRIKPTCSESGIMSRQCKVCGALENCGEIKKAAHKYYKDSEGVYRCIWCDKKRKVIWPYIMMVGILGVMLLVAGILLGSGTGSEPAPSLTTTENAVVFGVEETKEWTTTSDTSAEETLEPETQKAEIVTEAAETEIELDTVAMMEATTAEPDTEPAPTVSPTTAKPTEPAPTVPPTTAKPTEPAPTVPPTTAKPTEPAPTVPPTTAKPTEPAPTVPPTTAKPTEPAIEKAFKYESMVGEVMAVNDVKTFIEEHNISVVIISISGNKYNVPASENRDASGVKWDAMYSVNMSTDGEYLVFNAIM